MLPCLNRLNPENMPRYLPLFAVLFALLLTGSCSSVPGTPPAVKTTTGLPPTQRTQPLTGAQAITLAQAFVAAQGYTNAHPNLTKVLIQFEKDEHASDTAAVLKYRHNMLKPQAVGARQYDHTKWLVGFEYTWNEDNICRAVTMDSIGAKIYMQHQDVRIDWVLGEED